MANKPCMQYFSLNSRNTLMLLYSLLLAVHIFFYPKWRETGTETTISWDVSGYYMYLPAIFIYHDLEQVAFLDSISKTYQPAGDDYQAFQIGNGNRVMKYTMGQAIMYSPFFFLGHAWALADNRFPADGFSKPYQVAISLSSLVFALIGLWYLRKLLLLFFADKAVAWSLLVIVTGSNYLNYSAIDGALTHNYLFTLYVAVLWTTHQFWRSPNMHSAMLIGFWCGLAALTRPTELILIFWPVFWGLSAWDRSGIRQRFHEIIRQKKYWSGMVLTALVIGSMQLIYWRSVTGQWLFYSYEDQGFSWLEPHIIKGLFSYRSGWLVYSPAMLLCLIGFLFLLKKNRSFGISAVIYTVLFVYIAFSWDIWWYGNSLGQRAMIQLYPVLAFPLAAFFESCVWHRTWSAVLLSLFLFITVYLNGWFTYQAHKGGLLPTGINNRQYFWRTVGRFHQDPDDIKLLDYSEVYRGSMEQADLILDTSETSQWNSGPIVLLQDDTVTNEWMLAVPSDNPDWMRIYFRATVPYREPDIWKQDQLLIRYHVQGRMDHQESIRIQRLMQENTWPLYMDVQFNRYQADSIGVMFKHNLSVYPLTIDSILIYSIHE